MKYVYRLNPIFEWRGVIEQTGNLAGILYATLASAQAAITRAAHWSKRERRQQWESDRGDLITRDRVHE